MSLAAAAGAASASNTSESAAAPHRRARFALLISRLLAMEIEGIFLSELL